MEGIICYFIGLSVGIFVAVLTAPDPVTQATIEKAQAVCLENKGLKEIDDREFRCNNGAVFKFKGE